MKSLQTSMNFVGFLKHSLGCGSNSFGRIQLSKVRGVQVLACMGSL
jgi:hypothetical protein